ncbi:ATP-binding cassette subfamily B protein [Winogradskyella arenosi]|uniref:ATP-binding cassette subfamily B protein n=2 Tax=Winogradskyella arenosi TaxID=533325 RepID=A0A368ZD80_9FLAO|nr:ATP-binding cassette subfamily B protein [Winogradskyella arenosi]
MIKFRNQLAGNDCGIACLQMICQFYGKNYDTKTIQNYCEVSKLGISIKDIRQFLELVGIDSVSATISLQDTEEMPLPAILYYKKGHYVILEKIKKVKNEYVYYVIDPSFGKIRLNEEELSQKWLSRNTGIVIVLNPSNDFSKKNIKAVPKEKNNAILNNIKKILRERKTRLVVIFLLTMLALITNWGMPLLLKENIDKGILDKNIQLVWAILIGQFIFIISNIVATSFSDILATKISLDINIDLNKSYFTKILNLPISYFEKKFKSDLIEGLNDQNRINNFVSRNIIDIIITLLNLVVFSALLISYNYQIFLFFIVFSVSSIIVTLLFLKKKRIIDYSLFTTESENRNNIYELIMGITEIKVNSAENSRINKWKESESKLKKLKVKDSFVNFYMLNSNNFISKFRDIFLIGLCSFYVIEDSMTLGTMMMISYVLGQLAAPIDDIIDFSQTLQRLNLSFDRLSGVYNKPEEIEKNKEYFTVSENISNISLSNISFKYLSNSENYILNNIDLTIPTNKTTAIVGSSGSGKSTLMKLILGFYFPTQGVLKIGEHKIQDVNLKEWRKKCGVIMQEGYIFSGTIAENITFSDVTPNPERLEYSIQMAELKSTIDKLPMRLNTQIGESGISLSGGEKQRLYIARAIYKNPDFVFFDEATSSMDTITEKNIMNNFRTFLKNKTAVIIAHRLSTVKNAENIIVMKNGEVAEQGTHSQLLEIKGEYYSLVENQLELEVSQH